MPGSGVRRDTARSSGAPRGPSPTFLPASRLNVASVVLACFSTGLAAQGPASTGGIVPLTSEPSHHLALTTDYVRVFDVTAAPHATTLIHRHDHDYLFVTLGDADITSARTDAPPRQLVIPDGAIEYAAGGFAHSVANNLDRPFHNITIELLRPSSHVATCTDGCGLPEACAAGTSCATVTRSITSDEWVAYTIGLPPGATWVADSDWTPGLVVVVSESDLKLRGEYESTAASHRSPGNLIWLPARHGRRALAGGAFMQAITPAITNIGTREAKIVVIEWRKARG